MESRIIYITNDSRRYAAMQAECAALKDAGQVAERCTAVLDE